MSASSWSLSLLFVLMVLSRWIQSRCHLSAVQTACRLEKIRKMCSVMGIDIIYDPDPTYELTADNVKKMLAIYMRFRFSVTLALTQSLRSVWECMGCCLQCFLHCSLDVRKNIWPIKLEWWGVGMIICLKQSADCLSLSSENPIISCLIIMQNGFSFLSFCCRFTLVVLEKRLAFEGVLDVKLLLCVKWWRHI